MKVVLCSADINVLNRWEGQLSSYYDLELISDIEGLENIKESIIVISSCTNIGNKSLFLAKLVENKNKILVCERTPNLNSAKNYFALGVYGYGNSVMSSSYIISAIESIKNGFVWLLPQITTELLKDVSNVKENDDISAFENLTPTEKRVATLLKDGFRNQEISDMLEISINTVKKHIKNVYDKLNVKDRIEFSNLFN